MTELNQILLLFGAPEIPFESLTQIEQDSPELIVYSLPIVVFFTLLEIFCSWYLKKDNYEMKETLGSMLIGAGNLGVNLAMKITLLYGAVWIYNIVPWRMELNWWTFIPCYILYDLCSYWSHRISHFQRFFWASHVVHHSGEHYNLTVSFRQSWVQHFKIIFFLPLAFAGFHPIIFFVANQIAVLYQFWVHTEYIGKLHPAIEYIFATPSHHRVHHGSNEKYLDKNFAATFIFWDRTFGTFQKEEEKPDYGLTTQLDSKLNPLYLNFHEYMDILEDVKKAKGLRKKLYYIFGSPAKIAKEKKDKSLTSKKLKTLDPLQHRHKSPVKEL
ncbi:sterol desaturase family protein [Pedobacter sp. SYSU D00535]|uniref:sterol desaturase family protein n=1 Tax=Pedobacter sp. SYSU D00535 TaxID=2810308 RepID=UPI001A9752D7|nr:sterol desaturase family protein [Pedobacter sp. SYSU D00535]